MSALFTSAPLWVWPLLAMLLALGLNAMRTRTTPAWPLYGLPLLGVLSLRSVSALEAANWVWGVFALAYALGAVFGLRFQARRILKKAGRKVLLKGEALTLPSVMVLFWANFALGVLSAVAPDVLASLGFQAGFASVLAGVSGSFLGRAAAILRAPRDDG